LEGKDILPLKDILDSDPNYRMEQEGDPIHNVVNAYSLFKGLISFTKQGW
jgi:hypothetical protein